MSSDPTSDTERDQRHLEALRASRAAGDPVAERKALADLLDPYRQVTRNIAYGRLGGVPNRADEASRITQEVMVRVVSALSKRLEFSVPFHVVVGANREYALKDFWTEYRGNPSRPYEADDLVNLAGAVEQTTEFELARGFAPYLEGLTALERELVTERIFLDMSPQQSADSRGMKRNAVDQAYHRALKKLRANRPQPDVRNQDQGAA